MSHEQVVSRPSAETIPGAPFAGISVRTAMTATDQSSSPAMTDHCHPKRRARAAVTAANTRPAAAMSTSMKPTPP